MPETRIKSSGNSVTGFAVSLLIITSIVRLGTSLFLPALPAMGRDLGMDAHGLTMTMTVYWGVFGVAALFMGVLADARGRHILVVVGAGIYLAGSVLCGFAINGTVLIGGRVLQGIGGSAIPVTARAMIRDACDDKQVVKVLGWMGAFGGLVPVLAPVLGGTLTQHFGWRSNFYLLIGAAFLVFVFSLFFMSETLPKEKRVPFKWGGTLKAYASMLGSSRFLLVLLPIIFCFGIQGVYLSTAPFLFVKTLGLTPLQFGLTNLVLVGALIAGRYLCQFLVEKFSLYQAYSLSGAITFLGGLSFFAVMLSGHTTTVGVLAPAFLFGVGFGSLLPIGLKSAMTAFMNQSGAASALHGCLTIGFSAITSGFAGFVMKQGFSVMTILGIFTMASGFLILLSSLLCKNRLT